MNRGLRSAFALGDALLPTRTGLYALEVIFHKILRRFVAFFLLARSRRAPCWPRATRCGGSCSAPQLAFYALAVAGALLARTRWAAREPLWIPYYFCLANGAAALAVLSLLRAASASSDWEPAAELRERRGDGGRRVAPVCGASRGASRARLAPAADGRAG